MKYYLGLDIGGTFVKGVLTDGAGVVLAKDDVPTQCSADGVQMCGNILSLCERLQKGAEVKAAAAGVGCAGMIGSDGTVIFAGNLGLKNFPLAERLKEALGVPVKVTNDANAAALGEARFGAAKKFKDSIFVTLGTGVGGGIIIDGKLFEGGCGAGAEIGHMVVERGGNFCTCGRRGCWETYASATALIKSTREAMEEDPGSEMWRTYTPDTVTGKTAFEYCGRDFTAKKVVDKYIDYLACGIINLADIFRPQAVILGGGVSKEGDRLIVPLQRKLDAEIFGSQKYAPVKIYQAELGNTAGALGAAALNF